MSSPLYASCENDKINLCCGFLSWFDSFNYLFRRIDVSATLLDKISFLEESWQRYRKRERCFVVVLVATCILMLASSHLYYNTNRVKLFKIYHPAPLVRWLLYKYKCLQGVGGKGGGSSLQEGVSCTYTFRLCQSRNSILY